MNDRIRARYERGQRCETFWDAFAADFPAAGRVAALAAEMKALLAQLSAVDGTRANSAAKRRQGTLSRSEARRVLSARVRAVVDTARLVARQHPEINGLFDLPGADHTDQTLITTARAFAERAVAFVALFVEYGLPGTFIADLTDGADAMEAAISTQNQGVGERVNANEAADQIVRALDDVLAQLDVIIRNKYREAPATLAQWESAYHLEAAPGSRRKPDPDPAPAPAGA